MAGLEGYPGFLSDFVQGTTKDFVISLKRKDANGDLQPVDITGAKFYLSIATDRDPNTIPELEITIDPPTDPINGTTAGTITDTQTAALATGTYFYSVRYINPSGAAYVIDLAKIKCTAAVSGRLD